MMKQQTGPAQQRPYKGQTLSELKSLDFGSGFQEDKDEKIPELEEVFGCCRAGMA